MCAHLRTRHVYVYGTQTAEIWYHSVCVIRNFIYLIFSHLYPCSCISISISMVKWKQQPQPHEQTSSFFILSAVIHRRYSSPVFSPFAVNWLHKFTIYVERFFSLVLMKNCSLFSTCRKNNSEKFIWIWCTHVSCMLFIWHGCQMSQKKRCDFFPDVNWTRNILWTAINGTKFVALKIRDGKKCEKFQHTNLC